MAVAALGWTIPASVRAASPAIANPDTFSVVQGVTVTVFALANDTRGQGGPFNAPADVAPSSGATAAGGSYSCGGTGGRTSCRYTPPAPGFLGADSFTYRLAFPTSSTTWTSPVTGATAINLTVVANQAPTAVDDTADVVGSALASVDVVSNDTDPNLGAQGDRLSVVASTATTPLGSAVECATGFGGCTFRAPVGYVGSDTFAYTVRDANGLTDVGSVTMTVAPNTPPLAGDDTVAFHVVYGGAAVTRTIEVGANDSDVDFHTLNATAASPATAAGGGIGCLGTQCTYTPVDGFFGTDGFTYVLDDDAGGTDTATVTITVAPDAPPVAGDDSAAVRGSALLEIPVFDNDADAEGEMMLHSFDATTVNGATVSCGTDSGSGFYRGCRYQAAVGFVGTDAFSYRVGDASSVNTDMATVTVTVAPNQEPITRPDVYDTRYEPFDNNPTGLEVVNNDTDPEGDPLLMPLQFLTSTLGVPVLCSHQHCEYDLSNGHAPGIDTFTYTVADGHGGTATGTATVYISLNAPPIAGDDAVVTRPGVPVSVNVLANDCDPNCENDQGAVTAAAVSTNGGTVQCFDDIYNNGSFGRCVYTPPAGFSGTDTFGYVLTDFEGLTDTATVTVVVTDTEATSAVVGAGGTVDTDAEGDGATAGDPVETGVTTGAGGGTVTINEQPTASSAPGGFSLFGMEVVITAPAGTPAMPLRLSFLLDDTIVPSGKAAADVAVFRNGVHVQPCSGPAGTASPDPCVNSRTDLPGGDVQLVILTSAASTWGFGAAAALPFSGFFAPVDNAPVVNAMKAGRAVPVLFSLSGDRGMAIFAAGSPVSVKVSCATGAAVDEVEATSAVGSSSLTYDRATDRYQYVWKTEKGWAGTCRELRLTLIDGTVHTALFRLT